MISLEYPAILGGPAAGTVEAIGDGVDRVAVGQRIVSAMKVFTHKKAKYGGLQRFAVVNEAECVQVSICVRYCHVSYVDSRVTDRRYSFCHSGIDSLFHSAKCSVQFTQYALPQYPCLATT
jgi:NAD-dependent dihydropyrimidine dehydrogenase PreA subunit